MKFPVFAALVAVFLLSACGQSGALVMPDQNKNEAAPSGGASDAAPKEEILQKNNDKDSSY